jgi:hypothetical protein
MDWEAVETTTPVNHLRWQDLAGEDREALKGKLTGLFEMPDDESAFDSLSVAAQQALLLILGRLVAKDLWKFVINVSNVWGEGGVGFSFTAWPMIKSTLSRRQDFTERFANHRNTDGGFYEKGRSRAVMHFLYQDGNPPQWFFHFDLYNPLHSPVGAWRHFRYEVFSKAKPDWRMIQQGLDA